MDIGSMVNNPSASAGDVRDMGSILRSGRYPGEGNGNPLQYSCLGNPMDRGTWRATVLGVTESRRQLSTLETLPLYMHGVPIRLSQDSVHKIQAPVAACLCCLCCSRF